MGGDARPLADRDRPDLARLTHHADRGKVPDYGVRPQREPGAGHHERPRPYERARTDHERARHRFHPAAFSEVAAVAQLHPGPARDPHLGVTAQAHARAPPPPGPPRPTRTWASRPRRTPAPTRRRPRFASRSQAKRTAPRCDGS